MARSTIQLDAVRIDGERLWGRLQEMACIGGLASGGCNRQALTDEDKAGRQLFIRWCHDLGLSVTIDRMGNLFARREGRRPDLPPVLAGSHLDTQPTGGKFDGVYGVLAGLEAITTLDERGIDTERSIEVAVWTNEEGARFAPALLGSGVFAGVFTLAGALAVTDKSGASVADELERIGFAGFAPCVPRPIRAAFELHIEQGPILEAARKTIGIVTGVQGMRWYDVVLKGSPVHTGPTPMAGRRDVFRALPSIVQGIYDLAAQRGEWARAAFGDVRAEPGVRNTVPAKLVLAADLRYPDEATLEAMDAEFRALVGRAAASAGVDAEVQEIWRSPAIRFDEGCIEIARNAAVSLNYDSMEIISGAGHDSVYVAKVAPTSMIFIPCAGGISHNPDEWAAPEDVEAGANVLLHSLLTAAA